MDWKALENTVDNVRIFVSDPGSALLICDAIEETNLVDILISIPKLIKNWTLNCINDVVIKVVLTLGCITRNSVRITDQLRYYDKISKLFMGLLEMGSPTVTLLEACIELAFNKDQGLILIPEVLTKLLGWLPDMDSRAQIFLSEQMLKSCIHNYGT